MTRQHSKDYRGKFIGTELKVLWEDDEEINGETYIIGHTDRYVRVALRSRDKESYKASTGAISTVVPTAFLTPDTLLI